MTPLGTLSVTFHSWWRTSSGRSDGPHVDDCVERDASGLPFLPGKTLKGLFRDAAVQLAVLGHIDPDRIEQAFGRHVEQTQEGAPLYARFLTTAGTLRFGSAEMPAAWREWAGSAPVEDQSILEALLDTRAMTAINERGVAKTGSLRAQQVVVPLTLYAGIQSDVAADRDLLIQCAPLIRSIGAGRNRGFGRVSFTLEDPQ